MNGRMTSGGEAAAASPAQSSTMPISRSTCTCRKSRIVSASFRNDRITAPPAPKPPHSVHQYTHTHTGKGKGSPYSVAERWVPELIPVLGSQPAGDVSHKPGGRLPLLSSEPAVTLATLKRADTNFAAW